MERWLFGRLILCNVRGELIALHLDRIINQAIMAEYGFMGCGAVEPKRNSQLRSGMMFCGAKPLETKTEGVALDTDVIDQETQELIDEIKKVDEAAAIRVPALPEDKVVSDEKVQTVPNKDWHPLTLKKLALEKGYTGTAFDKKSLLEFLDANK